MTFEEKNPQFMALKERDKERVLKLYAVFPSGTTYKSKPTLDEFLAFTRDAKNHGYNLKILWQLYSGGQDIPAVLHALATDHAKKWSKTNDQ